MHVERQFPNGILVIDVQADSPASLGCLSAAELAGLEEQGEFPAHVADSLVCWFEDGSISMTEALWAQVLDERRRLWRPLGEDDLVALQRRERGDA